MPSKLLIFRISDGDVFDIQNEIKPPKLGYGVGWGKQLCYSNKGKPRCPREHRLGGKPKQSMALLGTPRESAWLQLNQLHSIVRWRQTGMFPPWVD